MEVSNPWNELVKIALLGTTRIQLSTEAKEALILLGWTYEELTPKAILEAGILWQQASRSGRQIPAFRQPLPVDETESNNFGDARVTQMLHHILEGEHEPLLPEFTALLGKAQQSLPPENIPELLNLCLAQPELLQDLAPLFGARGAWLMLQNPDWQELSGTLSIDLWDTGTTNERIALLRSLRRADPSLSRQLISSTWTKEAHSFKTQVLKVLNQSLEQEDRSIIDRGIEDKRKEVRALAARMAFRLPDHPLAETLGLFVLEQVQYEQAGIAVQLADDIPEAIQQTGAFPALLKKGQGLKASRLAYAIEFLDPEFITDHWAIEPISVLQLFAEAENYGDLFLNSLLRSVLTYERQDWAILFLQAMLEGREIEDLNISRLTVLIKLAGPKALNEILKNQVMPRRKLIREESPLFEIIRANQFPWPDDFSLQLVNAFKDYLYDTEIVSWDVLHYRAILEKVGLCASPTLFEEIKSAWPTERAVWGIWEQEVHQLLRRLQFRQKMYRIIKPAE
jgi:hypothetical protein